jgi:hypothetical protein
LTEKTDEPREGRKERMSERQYREGEKRMKTEKETAKE